MKNLNIKSIEDNTPHKFRFVISKRTLNQKGGGTKIQFVATPTDKKEVSFDQLCELVCKNSSYDKYEAAAMLKNLMDIAYDFVQYGNKVELYKLGVLYPKLISKSTANVTEFNVLNNVKGLTAGFQMDKNFKQINGLRFEQAEKGINKVDSLKTMAGKKETGNQTDSKKEEEGETNV